jgi:hypothetical protein
VRQAAPVIAKFKPAFSDFAKALPGLTLSFTVLNEFFNELAYNPGPNQGGFMFFADWAEHNVNSVYSTADAHGALGNTLVYFRCDLLTIIESVAKVNPGVAQIIGLLNLPKCASPGATTASAGATGTRATSARAGAASGRARAGAAGTSMSTSTTATTSATSARAAGAGQPGAGG